MSKIMKTMDGNTAAAYVSYAFTDVAAIYPITPSSTMAELVDEWAANGMKNIFGQEVNVTEMQSEAGAAGAVHGSLSAGALTTTFTASQGLLLMIPNMYKIAGELLPGVFHVSARAIAGHALSIFGDHSDVMAARQTGFALLASGSVQEVMDIAGVAHLTAIKSKVPFVHFFDGFRTSHEVQKIETIDFKEFDRLVDKEAVQDFRNRSLSPEHPYTKGTAQNPDIFFQAREASNPFYNAVPQIVADYMSEISKITGRDYKPFNYYGAADAEHIVIAMGSVTESLEETIDYLMKQGKKVGVIKVHLYRPWAENFFFDVLPATVKFITVMDRVKEPGAPAEPLHLDIRNMFYGRENAPKIVGGRYGLGSKDTTPSDLLAVFKNMESDAPRNNFTISIVDDVTELSLPTAEKINTASAGTTRCKFWGLGSDGTVGANKSAIKIIGDNTDMYAQGYFSYDSKKSGGITVSHLRFGSTPIRSTYLIDEADFIACHNQSYVNQYDVIEGLKKGGSFVLNCKWTPEELEAHLPAALKRFIATNEVNFYTVDATGIAGEIGLGNRINMIMQSAFFNLTQVMPIDDAVKHLKEAIYKSYGNKGEKIVNMNYAAVERGLTDVVKIEVPAAWANAVDAEVAKANEPAFITNILKPMNAQQGDKLPVSTFVGSEDGAFPHGTAAYEKRGIAVNVPNWVSENCIQCNQCSYVCPHAAIRPFLLNDEEKVAMGDMDTLLAMGKGMEGLSYRMQVTPLDCAGCGNCADICPGKKGAKALEMKPLDTQLEENERYLTLHSTVGYKDKQMDIKSIKGSQFVQPLLEFSGACLGCGETPYAKLVTQLYGDRMLIANATGCSSIWGGSAPSTPYTKNAEGKGPAWANSLFEDNAEYGYGMSVAIRTMRSRIKLVANEMIAMNITEEVKAALTEWVNTMEDADASKIASAKLLEVLPTVTGEGKVQAEEIIAKKDYLIKKSVWIFGGDGWAYDIGYGGLDHVIASGENVNILVFDTEVYSNTGGQSSKATPTGAVAKFAASGKKIKKKDLGMIATTYGYVYVAQVGMGADKNQLMKALVEAEKYDGPSLIIAYAPCINHGLKEGMGRTQENTKQAVDCGYWHLYRFNPELKEQGKNPFILDSKPPTASFRDFLDKQIRYTSLKTAFPETAEELFAKAEEAANERYEGYKQMASREI